MTKEELNKLYKKLISDDVEDPGFQFLKLTSQEKNNKKPIQKIPASWKKTYFKIYPRFPQISIQKYLTIKNPYAKEIFLIFKKRQSEREFKGKPISIKKISQLLYFSAGSKKTKLPKTKNKYCRMYPSAGARYPLELYPVIFRSKDLPLGIYHYNVKWNTLELLLKGDFRKEFVGKILDQKWIEKSSMVIIITSVFSRTLIKYKERGWRYIFFEAGHLAQNLYLISKILKIKCCAVGGFIDKKIVEILDLIPKNELPLYVIVIGK